MRKLKLVADSSADVLDIEGVSYLSVPMKIVTDTREFVDDASLDLLSMREFFKSYKGKSRTSCPNVGDWIEAFDGADDVICVTITSNLSGSYNAACIAKQMYEAENPGRRVFVLDTLSAGPEIKLVLERLAEGVRALKSYEQLCAEIQKYTEKTGLLFMLESMNNLANNGRVSPIVAKISGLIGICVVGKASAQGTLEPLVKVRGEKRALANLLQQLQKHCAQPRRIYIAHCENLAAAQSLAGSLAKLFSDTEIEIYSCRGLCSFYAEQGGLLVGYESE